MRIRVVLLVALINKDIYLLTQGRTQCLAKCAKPLNISDFTLGGSMITAMDRTFLLIGSILGFLGVAFGAFAAHALRSRVSPEMLTVFETAVRYQMYHTFAVLIVAAAIGRIGDASLLVMAGWFFFAGILLFSGSLYALALTGIGMFGALTPVGGLLFLIGWVCLAIFAIGR
jgi:uncharacterized membrane protein YgdD (TMEM256/DUF423 family)